MKKITTRLITVPALGEVSASLICDPDGGYPRKLPGSLNFSSATVGGETEVRISDLNAGDFFIDVSPPEGVIGRNYRYPVAKNRVDDDVTISSVTDSVEYSGTILQKVFGGNAGLMNVEPPAISLIKGKNPHYEIREDINIDIDFDVKPELVTISGTGEIKVISDKGEAVLHLKGNTLSSDFCEISVPAGDVNTIDLNSFLRNKRYIVDGETTAITGGDVVSGGPFMISAKKGSTIKEIRLSDSERAELQHKSAAMLTETDVFPIINPSSPNFQLYPDPHIVSSHDSIAINRFGETLVADSSSITLSSRLGRRIGATYVSGVVNDVDTFDDKFIVSSTSEVVEFDRTLRKTNLISADAGNAIATNQFGTLFARDDNVELYKNYRRWIDDETLASATSSIAKDATFWVGFANGEARQYNQSGDVIESLVFDFEPVLGLQPDSSLVVGVGAQILDAKGNVLVEEDQPEDAESPVNIQQIRQDPRGTFYLYNGEIKILETGEVVAEIEDSNFDVWLR